MNNKLSLLAERREQLVAQAAAQRTALAQSIEPWRTPLTWVDLGLDALRILKRRPVWVVGGVAMLAAMRLNRVGKWLRRGWITWQVVQKLRSR
ncbi:MAG: YqjK-like family protein [Gallionellaceae bacterium]|nr:YqjK-like family protein [Gallionellaceae bacterium]MDD5364654.1 YqjK-like family protein [Gallionellaceae bacterium]